MKKKNILLKFLLEWEQVLQNEAGYVNGQNQPPSKCNIWYFCKSFHWLHKDMHVQSLKDFALAFSEQEVTTLYVLIYSHELNPQDFH